MNLIGSFVVLWVLLFGGLLFVINLVDEDNWNRVDDRCWVHEVEDWRWNVLGHPAHADRQVFCESTGPGGR